MVSLQSAHLSLREMLLAGLRAEVVLRGAVRPVNDMHDGVRDCVFLTALGAVAKQV
jgi:hypothetical protein